VTAHGQREEMERCHGAPENRHLSSCPFLRGTPTPRRGRNHHPVYVQEGDMERWK
jgi:hypothetical protein